jgi:O-antigen ligase
LNNGVPDAPRASIEAAAAQRRTARVRMERPQPSQGNDHPPAAKSSNWVSGGLEAALFWAWLAATALSPVWFGSNLPLAWDAHATIFGTLLALHAALAQGRAAAELLRRLGVPLAAIGIVLAWALAQRLPNVPIAWQHPAWRMAAQALQEPLAGSISADPAATARAILWTASAAASFILAAGFGRDSRRAARASFVMVVGAGAIAAYGLAIYATGNDAVLWQAKKAYFNALTATFIGRDDYAAFAAMTMTAGLGLLLAGQRGDETAPQAHRLGLWRAAVLGLALMLLAISLVLTGSRSGVAMAALGILALFILQVTADRRIAWRFFPAALLAMLIAAGLLYFFGGFLIQRLANSGDDLLYRIALDRRMIAGIAAAPWFGHGYGAFEQAFPMFRDTSLVANTVYEYGHNDWLEALFTLGIPVGLLLWSVFLWMIIRCAIGLRTLCGEANFAAIALALLIATLLHALVEFNLQIQGFTLPLLAFVGFGVAQSWRRRA